MRYNSRLGIVFGSLYLIGVMQSANAVLGEQINTTVMKAQSAATPSSIRSYTLLTKTANYSVYESKNKQNTIHQYADSSGRVFAVTWQGKSMPNMDSTLGTAYHQQYLEAKAQQKPHQYGLRMSYVTTPSLVVQTFGIGQNFSGKAYLSNAVPNEVNINEVK